MEFASDTTDQPTRHQRAQGRIPPSRVPALTSVDRQARTLGPGRQRRIHGYGGEAHAERSAPRLPYQGQIL